MSRVRGISPTTTTLVLGAIAALGLALFLERRRRHANAPSFGGMSVGHDHRIIDMTPKYGDGSRDVVEQASWESFPASDPPAY